MENSITKTMTKTIKKATSLPDMTGWTDKQIDRWLETHDTAIILKKAILKKHIEKNPNNRGTTCKNHT